MQNVSTTLFILIFYSIHYNGNEKIPEEMPKPWILSRGKKKKLTKKQLLAHKLWHGKY